MTDDWSPQSLAGLTATALARYEAQRRPDDVAWSTEEVVVDAGDLLVTFGYRGTAYAARIDPRDAPVGPLAGERCDTPEQWAREVLWRFDEEISTGWVERAARTESPDGVVELAWR